MKLRLLQKKYSIKFSLSIIFSMVVLITSVFISFVFFSKMRSTMREDIAIRIHDMAAVAAHQIDIDLHASLTKPDQENNEAYKAIKKSLQQIRNGGTGIRYVYTLRRLSKNNFVFVVDGEEDAKLISHLGDVYNSFDIERPYSSGDTAWVNKEFDIDKWGTWKSGFIKLYNSKGEVECVLGIDVSADYILQREHNVFIGIVIIISLIVLVCMLFGIYLAREISKPLLLLERDMRRVKELKLNSNVEIKTIFSEIMSMKDAEDNMKKGLRSFKKYIPADLVNQLLLKNIEANIGGEKKELTIFFSDIENFTTISESMDPEVIAEYMKDYFEGLTKIILKHNGTVDKFIGDAIMAFWGAPNDMEDHAYNAALAALECQEFLQQFNQEAQKSGTPILITRIGLSTGEVVVGNFGYKERMNYTIFGNHVNLANRLEGLNKFYGTEIIISDSTYKQIADKFIFRKLDLVSVKGKKEGIFIYELVGLADFVSEDEEQFTLLFNEGMESYFKRDWDKAIRSFSSAIILNPNKAVKIMIYRCRYYIATPPPDDWDGTTSLMEK